MAICDVTVLGGGIFGLSIAYACVRRGAKVQVIEVKRIGAGSSGGLVGALAPHTPDRWNEKKQFQFESLIMARDWWMDIGQRSGTEPGYARNGRLQPLQDDRAVDLAHARVADADLNWRGLAAWAVQPGEETSDWLPPSATGLYLFDTLSARIHPRKAASALEGALTALGCPVHVQSAGKPGGMVIEATGVAGLQELSEALGRAVGNGVKGQSALFACDARDQPQLFSDGLHIVPHGDDTVAVGSTSEREFEAPDSVDDQLEAVIAKARSNCPALREAEVIDRWAGVRPRARSRAPILGQHPLRPDRYIANGGFKIGFGMAPKVAEVMAELVLEGRDTIPGGFRPETCL